MPVSQSVSVIFKAKDLVSGTFRRMNANAVLFGSKTDMAFRRASRAAMGFRSILGGILGANVISYGMMYLRQGIADVTTNIVKMDQALTSAATKFGEGIQKGTPAFQRLEDVAREIGKTTQFGAVQAAEGLERLAMAGYNSKQAIAMLPRILDFATAADLDLESATSMANDTLGAFGLMVEDAAQLAENMAKVNDVFAVAVQTSNIEMTDLYETMKYGGPVMKTAGQDIETFAAAAGLLGNASIKGSLAGTALKNAILNLVGPTPKIAKLLRRLGVVVSDSAGNTRDFFDILNDLREATKNMGTAQRSAALDTIFGKRAVAGMNVLLAKTNDELQEYRDRLYNSKGEGKRMADDMRKSLQNRLLMLKNALIELGFKAYDTFEKKIPGGIDAAIAAVSKFDISPIINGFKGLFSIIESITNFLKPFNGAMKGAAIAIGSLIVITKLATAAQWLWNTALIANPIGALIVSIGALIAASIDLYNNWDATWSRIQLITIDAATTIKKALFEIVKWYSELSGIEMPEWMTTPATLEREATEAKSRIWVTQGLKNVEQDLALKKITEGQAASKMANIIKGISERTKIPSEVLERVLSEKQDIISQSAMGLIKGQRTAEAAKKLGLPEAEPVSSELEELIRGEQDVNFNARIEFAGAPKGTKIKSKTKGANKIDAYILGLNP